MHKVDVRVDAREAMGVARRREVEKQRQARVFNARDRLIGVDVGTLEQQVKERQDREKLEKEFHNSFAKELVRQDKVTELLQQRQEKDMKDLNKSVSEYRQEFQRWEDRREFDLNDKDWKKKEAPARVSDDDPRLTVSGMQVFEGEDQKQEKRKKLQQEQMREWTVQQVAEKEKVIQQQKKADQLYYTKACEMDERAVELQQADEDTRRNITLAVKDYNRALARERAAQQQQMLAQEQDDNLMEMCNHVHSDILSENPAVAQSAFGGHRVIPDRWKGMTPECLHDIMTTREQQIQEKQREKGEERERDKEWARRRLAEAKAAMVIESGVEKKKKALAKKFAEDNRELAAEQRAKKDYLDKEVYVNSPNERFFAQFNTTSR